MESADLEQYFGDTHVDGANYRWGLKQILDRFLDDQKEKIEEILDESCNSPDAYIRCAISTYKIVNEGAFTTHKEGLKRVEKAIEEINQVISEFGVEEYPQAQGIRDDLLKLQDVIRKTMRTESIESSHGGIAASAEG